jgi:hypothetical protein
MLQNLDGTNCQAQYNVKHYLMFLNLQVASYNFPSLHIDGHSSPKSCVCFLSSRIQAILLVIKMPSFQQPNFKFRLFV